MLNRNGLWIPTKGLTPVQVSQIKRALCIKTHLLQDKYVQTSQYKVANHGPQGPIKGQTNPHIIVPRYAIKAIRLIESLVPRIDSKFNVGFQMIPHLTCSVKLQPNQTVISRHILEYFEQEAPNGLAGLILNLEAGQGKTFVAMSIIANLKVKTLVICHNETVLYDWKKELERNFRMDSDSTIPTVGLYYGKCKKDGHIVIGLINSMLRLAAQGKYDFIKQFGLIIYDEVHMYCSKKTSEVFRFAQAKYTLGLSATPNERIDKFDPVAWWGCGPVLDAKTLVGFTDQSVQFKGKVLMIKYNGPPEYTQHMVNKAGITDVVNMLTNLTKDPQRLEILCQQISRLKSEGFNVFVFADRKAYLHLIHQRLLKMKLESRFEKSEEADTSSASDEDQSEGTDSEEAPEGGQSEEAPEESDLEDSAEESDSEDEQLGAAGTAQPSEVDDLEEDKSDPEEEESKVITLTGGAGNSNIKKAEDSAQVILSTYQYMSVGKSIPKMNAIVLATPRKSKSRQIINRIFRLGSDYSIQRQIIDLVDQRTIFRNQWRKRLRYYKEKDYLIEEYVPKVATE